MHLRIQLWTAWTTLFLWEVEIYPWHLNRCLCQSFFLNPACVLSLHIICRATFSYFGIFFNLLCSFNMSNRLLWSSQFFVKVPFEDMFQMTRSIQAGDHTVMPTSIIFAVLVIICFATRWKWKWESVWTGGYGSGGPLSPNLSDEFAVIFDLTIFTMVSEDLNPLNLKQWFRLTEVRLICLNEPLTLYERDVDGLNKWVIWGEIRCNEKWQSSTPPIPKGSTWSVLLAKEAFFLVEIWITLQYPSGTDK